MTATLDVLIANEPGKSIRVPYKNDEPVFFLVQRISNMLGEKDGEIRWRYLYVNGIRVKDLQQPIEAYRIFGNSLTYESVKKGEMLVFVQTLTGKVFQVACNPQDTVRTFKRIVQDMEGVPVDQQRHIFESRQLENERTLESYHITNGSLVYWILRLRGGHISFSDVSNDSGVCKYEFSLSGPPGREVSPGTNVECNCECTPGYRVICRKQYGTIEVSRERFQCPNCHRSNRITPVTVGFMDCKHRFHGIKATGEQYTSEWKEVTQEDSYQLFSPSDQTSWKSLIIESAGRNELEDCTICLNPLNTMTKLDCGHYFHAVCYAQWNSSCPKCCFNQHLITGSNQTFSSTDNVTSIQTKNHGNTAESIYAHTVGINDGRVKTAAVEALERDY